MKVIFITIEAPFGRGEAFITNELESLRLLDKDIIIFPLRAKNYQSEKPIGNCVAHFTQLEKFQTIAYQLLSKFFKIARLACKLAWLQTPKRFLYTLYVLPRTLLLVNLIEKFKVQHIHAYWGSTPATSAFIAHELTGVIFSFTIHRADIEANDLLKLKSKKALFVRSISEFGKKQAVRLGVIKEKIHVIHLGVQPQLGTPISTPSKNTIDLISVANLIKIKRIDQLINKIAELPSVSLTVAGDGPQKKKLKKIIKKLKIENRVKLLGHISQHKLFSFYRHGKFNLFILPSKIEGIPVAAMEAMNYCIPVALTKVGGNKELIDDSTGYYLKNNLSNLSDILKLIPEKQKIQRAKIQIAKNFDTAKNSLALLELIKNEH